MTNQYSGKTTLISGGAGGIGFALAKEFGSLGMNVVIADIDEKTLATASTQLQNEGVNVLALKLDVSSYEDWEQCVSATEQHFGKLHMVVNNAGVGGIPGKIEETDHATWRWVVDVNMMGVLYGTQAATPALKRHGEGGWIVNVASMAGMMGVPYSSAYAATKAAVVSMTESWAVELKAHNIAVSALCPAFVKTRIHESLRNKQAKYQSEPNKSKAPIDKQKLKQNYNAAAALVESGIEGSLLAKRVVEALDHEQMYIFTHPNYREVASYRAHMLNKAFDDAEQSELVKHLMGQEIASL
ncbi:SDR family NAD(P)-dependent oxidoreductase [Glaciecola sp. MH2013]|uniref:SDR family NAD(P)-dependent oxidoreductase n=1 Tax=Glaciecola sp. MH2013 TaxID=2785524 RepID=UPI00189F7D17|nr:SDR family NAD(P)-dependent oxidoreductase [Glaciecola sp. MH2013]MBF7074170.1 SDR family NAD(P)-dependent oxidoreductase [Glaciecola sp. MH2013]